MTSWFVVCFFQCVKLLIIIKQTQPVFSNLECFDLCAGIFVLAYGVLFISVWFYRSLLSLGRTTFHSNFIDAKGLLQRFFACNKLCKCSENTTAITLHAFCQWKQSNNQSGEGGSGAAHNGLGTSLTDMGAQQTPLCKKRPFFRSESWCSSFHMQINFHSHAN